MPSLYIAQIKRKYGINARKNYRISNKKNQPILKCPIEKENLILQSLSYFKMIK